MNTMAVPYKHFYSCNALRILRSSSCLRVLPFTSQFVILLAAPPHSSRQLLCSSQPFTQPLLHFVSFHLVRSTLIATVPGILIQSQPNTQQHAHALSQANTHRSPGYISLHSVGFRSVLFSPPAATLFCSPAAPSGYVHCVLLIASVVPPVRKAAHQFTCIRQPPPYPDGKFTTAASYVASIAAAPWPRCFLIGLIWGCCFTTGPFRGLAVASVRSSLRLLMARYAPALLRRYFRRAKLLFAAGAFTGNTIP